MCVRACVRACVRVCVCVCLCVCVCVCVSEWMMRKKMSGVLTNLIQVQQSYRQRCVDKWTEEGPCAGELEGVRDTSMKYATRDRVELMENEVETRYYGHRKCRLAWIVHLACSHGMYKRCLDKM